MRRTGSLLLGLAVASMLAACGPEADAEGTTVLPSRTAGPFETYQSNPAVAGFVAAFTAQYPQLAEGRKPSAIASDVTHICLDDLRNAVTGEPATDGGARALANIPARFERNGITPDAATAQAILALARSTVCDVVPAPRPATAG